VLRQHKWFVCFISARLESMLTRDSSRKLVGYPRPGSDTTYRACERLLHQRSTAMTNLRSEVSSSTSQQRARVLRRSLAFILCLGTFAALSPATVAGNRCKDRCNDSYHLRKDLCKSIPLKHERHRCEDAAKRSKDNCKRGCR